MTATNNDHDQGRSDGGISWYIPPPKKKKSAQVNFLRGKNAVKTAVQQFYTPKNLYTPQNKFLATPLTMTATRYTMTATAMKTWKCNDVFWEIAKFTISLDILFHFGRHCLWPSCFVAVIVEPLQHHGMGARGGRAAAWFWLEVGRNAFGPTNDRPVCSLSLRKISSKTGATRWCHQHHKHGV